jgi:hypothetical protein
LKKIVSNQITFVMLYNMEKKQYFIYRRILMFFTLTKFHTFFAFIAFIRNRHCISSNWIKKHNLRSYPNSDSHMYALRTYFYSLFPRYFNLFDMEMSVNMSANLWRHVGCKLNLHWLLEIHACNNPSPIFSKHCFNMKYS